MRAVPILADPIAPPFPGHPASSYLRLAGEEQAWAAETFSRLTLEQKIGQVLHPRLFDGAARAERHCRAMAELQFGGGFVAGSCPELREAVAGLAAESAVPPLFSSDLECGARLVEEAVPLGAAMSLAAIADPAQAARHAYEAGRAAALQGGAAGIRWSFAPVADINFHPDNPITNVRSFGDDPERVALLVEAYARGLQDHGMAATLKHFPGDGVDPRDQHLVTTLNALPREEWERTYGRTFRAGIAAGAYAVMAGHIALAGVSARDQVGRYLPATLDEAVQVGLLRGKLGFQGVLVSDALPMGGLRSRCRSEAEAVVANVAAGSDVVLLPGDARGAAAALRAAVEEGVLPARRLDDAVWRLLCLKARLGLHRPGGVLPDDDDARRRMAPEAQLPLARSIAELSVALERDRGGDYPLRAARGGKIVLCELPRDLHEGSLAVATEAEKAGHRTPLEEALRARGFRVVSVGAAAALEEALPGAAALVYVARTVCQAGRGSIRLTKGAHALIRWEAVTSRLPAYLVSFGTPYVGWELSDFPNFACAFLGTPVLEETYARLLLGEIPFRGRLPVRLPEA